MTSNRPTTDNQPDDLGGDDQLELYVLDMLSDDERAEVENRLLQDREASERVRELRSVAAMLAFDLEPMQPSTDLRSRILDAAREDVAVRVPVASPPPAPISLSERREADRKSVV